MPSCCYGDDYAKMFSEGTARRTARRFARKGLRGSARLLTDTVAGAGIHGATILEVGGGVGDIHVDLLRRGADRATNVELSPGWEAPAAEVLATASLGGRVQRLVGDFVDMADDLGDFDVVILHRVVCCYPDWAKMLAKAAAKARRLVAVTVPVDRRASRAAIRVGNALLRLRSCSFRAYVHSPERMMAALAADGLALAADHREIVWHTFMARRPD